MKKFNDIFSIDSSTGGGKRLIKNIINKYRLGNEYKEIKENIENKGSSKDDYEYYILGNDISQENTNLIGYISTRASAYNYSYVGYILYINASIINIFTDVNMSLKNVIIKFNKVSNIIIHNADLDIIKDNIDIYDYLVLLMAGFGKSMTREDMKQAFPLIQSSREEYYNIVDLDLPKNYEKILEERGYID